VTEHEHTWTLDSFATWKGGPVRCVCGVVRPLDVDEDGDSPFDDSAWVARVLLELETGHTNVQAPPAIVAPEAASEAISEEMLVKIAKASKPGTSPRHWLYLRKKAARKVKAESRRKNRRG
jgi:hypothetical protein